MNTPCEAWLSFENQMIESRGDNWWSVFGQPMQTAYFMGILSCASTNLSKADLKKQVELGMSDAMKAQTGGKQIKLQKPTKLKAVR